METGRFAQPVSTLHRSIIGRVWYVLVYYSFKCPMGGPGHVRFWKEG